MKKAAYRLSALFGALSFILGLAYCLLCILEIIKGVKTVSGIFSRR